ncbi:DUF4372 domain-containing protein [Bacteroides faecis]|nr:DUF4372 domain-containing protein [Bacteroides faecis]MDC7978286.1 DUF4372 domain-containing protein [Bacteroides faecis]
MFTFFNKALFKKQCSQIRGKHHIKHFTYWKQLLTMMLEQLSNHESLRDLIVFLETHQKKHYRLELGHEPIVKTMLVSGQSKPSKTLLST